MGCVFQNMFTYYVEHYCEARLYYKSHVEDQEWKHPGDSCFENPHHGQYVEGEGNQHDETDADGRVGIKIFLLILRGRVRLK